MAAMALCLGINCFQWLYFCNISGSHHSHFFIPNFIEVWMLFYFQIATNNIKWDI